MCLIISVELLNTPKKEAELIPSHFPPSSALELHFEGTTSFFGRGNPRLGISEAGEGCACSMLTDDADWKAVYWDIQPSLLQHIASVLSFIDERAANGFAFEALWIGDKPKETVEVSLESLKDAVLKNQIKTKARYIIPRHAPLNES